MLAEWTMVMASQTHAPVQRAEPPAGIPVVDLYAKSGVRRGIAPAGCEIASLPYDGVSTCGARTQDFESVFDVYDLFIIEDMRTQTDARLTDFRSAGFGNGNPFLTKDVPVRIFTDDGSGLPGSDGYTGLQVMASVPGAGFFDGSEFITEFDGGCLPAGAYFVVWTVRLDFEFGAIFCHMQEGEHERGGGEPNNAWLWNPGEGVFGEPLFPVLECGTGSAIGVNFRLCGEPASCGNDCANPDCPADLDLDGDADSDDFFLYLDRFAGGDPCADIDGDTDADSDDFFAYLDLFAAGC